jgi:DNA recombination protein RmuC
VTEEQMWLVIASGGVIVLLQLILLLRRPRFDTPPDLSARLTTLESTTQSLMQVVSRTEGDLNRQHDAIENVQRTHSEGSTALARTVDDKLKETIEEGRVGRRELTESFSRFDSRQNDLLTAFQQTLIQQLQGIAQGSSQTAEHLRNTLNERLATIQADTALKLEEMRRTVDEKLHATLEQRLGESFKQVSERLEQVHKGLGEMQTLAGNVGDLKRVMTNVRTRGTWGELQLGALIESLLTPEQYERNVKTVPGSNELVEFAIRMPGQDDRPLWLPIDSKYPVEDYQRLLDAHETGDKIQVQQTTNAFESSLRNEAKKIATKYLSPPHTTDFAILFLPTEGLFAEALRIPGLFESLQNNLRIVITGPTTLAATLNSLRLGFRTLAIEKRSSEVWELLAVTKTEFRKFGEAIDATRKSIDQASSNLEKVGTRTRAIERKLRTVESIGTDSGVQLQTDLPAEDDPD